MRFRSLVQPCPTTLLALWRIELRKHVDLAPEDIDAEDAAAISNSKEEIGDVGTGFHEREDVSSYLY